MSPLKISVTGKSSIEHAPERTTLRFSVRSNGTEQIEVAKEVTLISNNLQAWLKSSFSSCTDDATEPPLTKFSSTSLRTWTKSTDRHDIPVPNPHHASISFTAVFRDFSKLNHAVGELLRYPKVEIDSLNWSLTDETGTKVASEARKLALRDAIRQADDYSEVLGRAVSVVEITDQGFSPYRTTRHMVAASMVDFSGSDPAPLDLTPQDVEVESQLNVTFEAVSDA